MCKSSLNMFQTHSSANFHVCQIYAVISVGIYVYIHTELHTDMTSVYGYLVYCTFALDITRTLFIYTSLSDH